MIGLQQSIRRNSLLLFFLMLLVCGSTEISSQVRENDGRSEIAIEGKIRAGESFSRKFGPDFIFELCPDKASIGSSEVWVGWHVLIRAKNSEVDLTEMTPPWHGPNPLIIMGWNLLPGENAPHEDRRFIFSPAVGKSITWEMVNPKTPNSTQTNALLAQIERFGRGELHITQYELTNSKDKPHTGINWMDFVVRLSWPSNYKPR